MIQALPTMELPSWDRELLPFLPLVQFQMQMVPHSLRLNLQPASATFGGVLTSGVQTIAGAKTFSGAITASNLSGTNSGDVTLGAIGAVPNANGASLVGQVLTIQPADATFGGVLTAGVQSIAGAKTFTGAISASNLSGTNSGNVTLGAFGAVPNANGASLVGQVLTIQPASETRPGAVSTTYQEFLGDKVFLGNVEIGENLTLGTSTALTGTITKNGVRILSTPVDRNTFLGEYAGNYSSGSDNTMLGYRAGQNLTAPADNNTGVGSDSLRYLLDGVDNNAFGEASGSSYTGSETGNCCIAAAGVLGDNFQIRIGNSFHTNCTVQGIHGVTTAGATAVVINAAGLLGTIVSTQTKKREIEDVGDEDVQRYLKMRARKFKMNGDDTNEQHWGVVVEETDEIMPELSLFDKEGKFSSFKYQELDGLVLATLKSLQQRIIALESELAVLQSLKK